MFVLNLALTLIKNLIVIVGTIACAAFALGRPGPFKWALKRIEKRNQKNIRYIHSI
jgi:hypothetical protein